ncbi:hypothetical protein JCM10908_005701 [Rhodotorula pacifica]|uniref:uncharacterized protein n=1 Tax=Rhodotorula pacifica TaxID=1495444 RepID=UPI00317B58A0
MAPSRKSYSSRPVASDTTARIHATLEGLGYQRTKSDACINVQTQGGQTHYIALYVNEHLFVSPSLDKIQHVKDGLRRKYGIKDRGKAKCILGIQIHRCANGGIFLSQCAHLEDVLLRLGYAEGCTTPTPMQANQQLRVAPEDHQPTASFRARYLQAVGPLTYVLGTRPYMCYAVDVLGRHAARPHSSHWAAVIRVLTYIRGTPLSNGWMTRHLPGLRHTQARIGAPDPQRHARLWATPLSSHLAPCPGCQNCSRASPGPQTMPSTLASGMRDD